jgi:hypothetical protein
MPIAFSCHECDRRYQANEDLAGKRIKCKQCGTGLKVPGSRSPAPSSSPATRTAVLAAATPRAAAARSSGRAFDAYGLDDEAPASRSDPFDIYDVDEAAPKTTAAAPGDAGVSRRAGPAQKAPKKKRREGSTRADDGSMRSWGNSLIVIGLGSFVLPLFGLQFKIINIFGAYQGIAGIVAAVLGLILVLLSSARVPGAIVGLTLGGAALAACGALYLGSQGQGRAATAAKSPRPAAAVVVTEDRADDSAEDRAATPATFARPTATVAVRVDRADDPMVGHVSWTPPPRPAAPEFHLPARPSFPARGSFPRPSFPARVAAP